MKRLAFDTALSACSAAVFDDDVVCAQCWELLGRGHAERLLPMLQQVLSDAALGFADLDLICVTVGPGTFAGVRVGLSVARGLALATGTRLRGVNTLQAIALGAEADTPSLVVLDARRAQVYAQAFDAGGAHAGTPPALLGLPGIADLVARSPISLLGTGAELALPYLRREGIDVVLSAAPALPDAARFGAAAARCVDLAALSAPLEPLYLRPADAKLPQKRR